jgi:hypothetical protein
MEGEEGEQFPDFATHSRNDSTGQYIGNVPRRGMEVELIGRAAIGGDGRGQCVEHQHLHFYA